MVFENVSFNQRAIPLTHHKCIIHSINKMEESCCQSVGKEKNTFAIMKYFFPFSDNTYTTDNPCQIMEGSMGKSPMENSDGSRQIDIGILFGLVKELGVTLRPGPANKDAGKWDKICALYRMVLPKQGNFVTSSDLKRAYYSLKTTKETNEDSGPPTKRPRVSQACFSKLQCSTEHWDMLFEDPSVIIPVPADLNGSGANIFLGGSLAMGWGAHLSF